MISFISAYIGWHYGTAISNVITFWLRALWFVNHFFSITLLLRTLFTPWRRLGETYRGGLNLEDLFSVIIVNTLMRIVGALIRIVIILLGLLFFALVLVGGAAFLFVWLAAPLVVIYLFTAGLAQLS